MAANFFLRPGFYAFLISALALWGSTPAFAQKEKNKRDVQVIDFGEDDKEERDNERYLGMIVKTNPVSFLFGHQTVELEKEINGLISVQGGLGLTFRSMAISTLDPEALDYVWVGNPQYLYCDSEQWVYDECDDYLDMSYRRQKAGPKFVLSGRLFFDNDGYEGIYISPSFQYSRVNFEVQRALETSAQGIARLEGDWQKERETYTDFTIRLGYSVLHDLLTHEAFVGVGFRQLGGERQDLGRDLTYTVRNGVRQLDQNLLRVELGIRLGFQL